MKHFYYAIDDGEYCGIYSGWKNFVNRCPDSSYERFGNFANAFQWVTDQRYNPISKPPDNLCRWKYSNGDVPMVFTDGAAFGNGRNCKAAGYGIFWGRLNKYNISAPLLDKILTNNRAELMGPIVATAQAIDRGYQSLHICTDSKYAIICFYNMRFWKRNGWQQPNSNWKKAKNIKYLERWIHLLDKHGIHVEMEFVRGHQNDGSAKSQGNIVADWLATRGAEMCKP